jgi:hypothetical protein
MLGGGSDLDMNWAQIDVPTPLAHIVGVTDGIAELRPFAADITNSCHNSEVPSRPVAKYRFYRNVRNLAKRRVLVRVNQAAFPMTG